MSDYERDPREQLSHLFGSYKAEWLKEQLFDLFTEPAYFPELQTARPCILVGGRGTGKTTVLRSLAYDGQFALRNGTRVEDLPYYGFYYRVNTNRVTAFQGPELPEEEWIALFAHYLNLLMCEMTTSFLKWFNQRADEKVDLPAGILRQVALALNLDVDDNAETAVGNLDRFSLTLAEAKIRFEAFINNVIDGDGPALSMQGAPFDLLFGGLHEIPIFADKNFFFLIDEYENFEAYQQRIVNTLIKHSGQLYTFKIGVREQGIKEKATLNPNEQLISPSDYVNINITEKLSDTSFEGFARQVCNERIARIQSDREILRDVTQLLPGLSDDREAELLGINEIARSIEGRCREELENSQLEHLVGMSPLQMYFLDYWAHAQGWDLTTAVLEFERDPAKWRERFQNYKHALLFTIKRGKSGIHKYYAGWDVFIRLSGNNIRYLLELVEQSLVLSNETDMSIPVSFDNQTRAAQRIGKKNLGELEGLSVSGAQLKKLLLSLGRIFQVMAFDASRHAPEVNQFRLSDQNLDPEVEKLLKTAVMHLALLRFPGNKLTDEADTREHDFMIHPIFTAFFEFSYRRKRKMTITGRQLVGLVREPRGTLREILARTDRSFEDDVPLPEQMRLFENYYHGGNL